MPMIAANGVKLNVQDLGVIGTRVVMLHGLLIGSAASWYFTSAPVLARTHRVRVYDLRGHGMSEHAPVGYDVRTMAGDLAGLVDDERVDLVGHSWGALIALRFALDQPHRVRRLVLVEAPVPPSSVTEMSAFLDYPGTRSESGFLHFRGDLASALPPQLRVAGRRGERLVRALSRLVLDTTLVDDLRAERDPDPRELARLHCPTLLVYGDRSSCAPGGRKLAEAIPGARHVTLPGGHYLHLDARDALTDLIAEFLDG
jgi:pimeloyl-ACP methyl ester carboxylesterase